MYWELYGGSINEHHDYVAGQAAISIKAQEGLDQMIHRGLSRVPVHLRCSYNGSWLKHEGEGRHQWYGLDDHRHAGLESIKNIQWSLIRKDLYDDGVSDWVCWDP